MDDAPGTGPNLAAFDRACRAVAAARGARAAAPVLQLSASAVAALYAPAIYESLVSRPLKITEINCVGETPTTPVGGALLPL